MCLAIPSKIININGETGTIEVNGVKKEVNLMLIENPLTGDYVIIHAGYAIHKIDEKQALESLKVIYEAVSLLDSRK